MIMAPNLFMPPAAARGRGKDVVVGLAMGSVTVVRLLLQHQHLLCTVSVAAPDARGGGRNATPARFRGFCEIFRDFYGIFRDYEIFREFTRFFGILRDFSGFYKIVRDFIGFYGIFRDCTGFYWIVPDFSRFDGFCLISLNLIGFYRIFGDFV